MQLEWRHASPNLQVEDGTLGVPLLSAVVPWLLPAEMEGAARRVLDPLPRADPVLKNLDEDGEEEAGLSRAHPA